MFSYKTPKININLNIKKLSIFFTAIYIISLIPMLIMGFYDFPSADDFSMALETRQYFVQYGGFLGTILASLKKSWIVYSQYEGYFFSIILTCICPSVFGESFYFITPFIVLSMLTFGVCYFFDALFVRTWHLDKNLTNVVRMATLVLMIQCLNGKGTRVEAFYWYSGAINYTFTFGMAFFWLGLLLRAIYDNDEKARKRKFFWACFWGFFMGGANYLSALELAIISVLIIFIFIMVKFGGFKLEGADEFGTKMFGRIWIPTLINLIGFSFSCFGPGNSNRFAETTQNNPVKAVLISLYDTFDLLINGMMRWEVIVVLILLIPICWKLADKMKYKFEHPIMFALFAYLLVSSNMTPSLFATSNIDAGRLRTLAWMEFVLMSVLVVFYFTVYIRQYFRENYISTNVAFLDGYDEAAVKQMEIFEQNNFSQRLSLIIICLLVVLVFGSALCIKPEPGYYSGTSALFDIISGKAATYKAENMERLKALRDETQKSVGLKEHTAQPELLFYMDVTPDSVEWINQATAIYYEKEEVYLIPKN